MYVLDEYLIKDLQTIVLDYLTWKPPCYFELETQLWRLKTIVDRPLVYHRRNRTNLQMRDYKWVLSYIFDSNRTSLRESVPRLTASCLRASYDALYDARAVDELLATYHPLPDDAYAALHFSYLQHRDPDDDRTACSPEHPLAADDDVDAFPSQRWHL